MARPKLELVPTGASRALIYKFDRDLWPVYHYHPEIDILLILKNHGEFISGDYIGRLEPGTLIMNGPNIPHALHTSEAEEREWDRPAVAVIQFSRKSLGEDLLAKVEMQEIHHFLEDARNGFEFFGKTRIAAKKIMLSMADLSELERVIELFKLLHLLAKSPERQEMASAAYSPSLRDRDINRIDTIIRYLQAHKSETITLEQVAAVVHMSPKSFCRFFKTNTGKTLIQYVNELRIGEACEKLMQTDQAIIEIAFDVGFNNLSNFNRRFKALKNRSPREFRKLARHNPDFQDLPLPAQKTFA
ncbi:MAG: helix-turn-helix transcriptional regulator [Verrucomicrobia bacterium]|nr:helix-turn-helix transcriptional regulator [Verrucomicrobiota bacterium]